MQESAGDSDLLRWRRNGPELEDWSQAAAGCTARSLELENKFPTKLILQIDYIE